jgi:hypothetical protein
MIGGWMLTESGQTKAEGYIQPFILSWWSSDKPVEKGIEGGKWKWKNEKELSMTRGYGFSRGYPFVAPSVESLTPSSKMLRMKLTSTAAPKSLNPWVVRCRIAAVTSGTLLVIALVVAIVVINRYR